mmetsp:Transcript_2029/g.3661  ORF Transcript_2029/g.3661 Transcript_2029/m.3661 type:complete len:206 (+) Transcript_2029:1189-1806(+)
MGPIQHLSEPIRLNRFDDWLDGQEILGSTLEIVDEPKSEEGRFRVLPVEHLIARTQRGVGTGLDHIGSEVAALPPLHKASRRHNVFDGITVRDIVVANVDQVKWHLLEDGEKRRGRMFGQSSAVHKVAIHDEKEILLIVISNILELQIVGEDVTIVGIAVGLMPPVSRHPPVHIRQYHDVEISQIKIRRQPPHTWDGSPQCQLQQ